MKKFVEDFINFDSISCMICLDNYSNDKPAKILKCGHTICKECLDSFIQKNESLCQVCKEKYDKDNSKKLFWENKMINNLIDLSKFLNINIDKFLLFPLNFKYCEKCDIFITNYSFYAHQSFEHKLQSFDKQLALFFKKYNLSKRDKLIDDKNKFIIIFLYFYKSPFLHKIKFFESNITILLSNGEYKFYGQSLSKNEDIFFSNITMKKKDQFGKWHKGALINRKIGLIIHGYFYIQSENNTNSLYPILFGLFNYNDLKFFGFIKINKEKINNEEKLDISDFIFECGLLYDKKYFFGEFNNENYFKNFENEINNSNKIVDDKKIIKKGEIITVKEEGVEIKRIPGLGYKVEIINSKILIKKPREYISISPLNTLTGDHNYNLNECKINISKYNKTIIFRFYIENSIIALNSLDGKISKNLNMQEGFLITFNDSNLLEQYKSLTLQKIIDDIKNYDYNFIYDIYNLFEIDVNNCKIKYYIFEIKNDLITELNEKYYEIEQNQVKERFKSKRRNSQQPHEIYHKIIKIKDLFNNESLKNIINFTPNDKDIGNSSCCSMI